MDTNINNKDSEDLKTLKDLILKTTKECDEYWEKEKQIKVH